MKKIFLKKNYRTTLRSRGKTISWPYIIGTCPCVSRNLRDQCESCGSSLSSSELINPKSTISGSEPENEKQTLVPPLHDCESFLDKWIIKGYKNIWKTMFMGK